MAEDIRRITALESPCVMVSCVTMRETRGENRMGTKFTVIVTRDVTQSSVVEIEADDQEQAEDMALGLRPDEYDWALDDVNDPKPYVTSCEESDEPSGP